MGNNLTAKDDRINTARQVVELEISGDPSYNENVQILNKNSINCRLTNYRKDNDTSPKMDIQATMENEFQLGDVFLITDDQTGRSSHWICTDRNNFFNIYYKGLVRECNHLFRFQNGTPEILEYWGFIENPYSTTLSKGNVLTYPTNKMNFTLPYNDDTKKIHKNKRFITEIGYDQDGKEIPVVYEITSNESITTSFGGGKFLKLMAEFSMYKSSDNMIELVADYIKPNSPSLSLKPPNLAFGSCKIDGSLQLKSGGSPRTYTATFYDADGITPSVFTTAVWTLDATVEHIGLIHLTRQDDTTVTLQCDRNDEIIGSSFKLILRDIEGVYNATELEIKVVSPF